MKNLLRNAALLLLVVAVGLNQSCKKDDKSNVTAGFTFEIDAADFRTVHFTNTSTDFAALSWNFGDGSPLVTDLNPSHTFEGEGEYQVALTATDKNGKDFNIVTQKVTLVDPDKQLTALVGSDSKTWKLLRVPDGDKYPLEVGPIDRSTIWWAQGLNNDEIARRPCLINDEWTFTRDGEMIYNSNGDFWAEGGVFDPANDCFPSDAAHLTGPNGTDLSAFGDGTHSYSFEGNGTQLKLSGNGAWIGLTKIGTDNEVNTPQDEVTLDIVELTDGDVDYLVLESTFNNNDPAGAPEAYWRIVLVHYDDPADEPAIPSPKPIASFSTTVNALTVTFVNNSEDADSYSWDFGDGSISSEESPTHTYAGSGEYNVKLTATNAAGSAEASLTITVTDGAPMTADKLVGGAWRVRNAANSVVVGPGLGDGSWWQVPADGLNGTLTGPEDWSCMVDDDFIFTAGGGGPLAGTMEYKTNGFARNDGYFGNPQGCWDDAAILASPGAAFASAVHSYQFIPASDSPSGRPRIVLTNAPNRAAFIGFYKGYYGGENGGDNTIPPNGGNTTNQYEIMSYLVSGGQEVMTVSVDLNGDGADGNAWTMVMVR